MKCYTAFEYMYRDAGNYKAFGMVPLEGEVGAEENAAILSALIDGAYFIAEAVGIPELYGNLWEFGEGPTEDDHGFHEFVRFRPLNIAEEVPLEGCMPVAEFVERFRMAHASRPLGA